MYGSRFFAALYYAARFWSATGGDAVVPDTPFRLLQVMSFTGGPQAVQSHNGGAGDRIQSFTGGPVHVLVADVED